MGRHRLHLKHDEPLPVGGAHSALVDGERLRAGSDDAAAAARRAGAWRGGATGSTPTGARTRASRTRRSWKGREYGKDLYENRLVRTIDRLYIVWVAVTLGLPFLIGYAVGGDRRRARGARLGRPDPDLPLPARHLQRELDLPHVRAPGLPLPRPGAEQLARRGPRLRRGLAQQPPRLPGLGAPRSAPLADRRLVVGDPRPREASARLERARCPTPSSSSRRRAQSAVGSESARSSEATCRGPDLRHRAAARACRRPPERDPVQRPRDQRVLALDAERAGALEAAPRGRRADPRDPRQPAVERAVDDREPVAAEGLEATGDPGARARGRRTGLDRRLDGRLHRDRAAHREAEQQHPRRSGLDHGGPRVGHAPVQPLPRLDAVPHLGEAERRKLAARGGGRATRATRSRFLRPRCLWPAVHADDAEAVGRAGEAQLGACRELPSRAHRRTATVDVPAQAREVDRLGAGEGVPRCAVDGACR